MKRITYGEIWDLVETGIDHFNNTRVTGDFMKQDKNESSSYALIEVLYRENRNYWLLVTRYRISK